jgi:plastocyanin
MKRVALRIQWLVIGAAASLVLARAAATVEGQVKLPPAPRMSAAALARYENRLPIGQPDAPRAIVYLEGDFPLKTNEVVKVEQLHYQFSPGVVAVQKGTTVEFPNRDDDYHSVFSLSKTKRFDLGQYRKDEKGPTQTFDQAGLVRLFCAIHEHMRGYILVLETPYFKRTEKDGKYKLENLPAGKYTLKAWVDEKTSYEKAVELKDGETLKVDFLGK